MSTRPAPVSSRRPASARSHVIRRLVVLDMLASIGAVYLAVPARDALGEPGFSLGLVQIAMLAALCVVGLVTAGCYRPAATGLGVETFRRFFRGVATVALLLGFISYLLDLNLSRIYAILVLVLLTTIGMLFRLGLRAQMSRHHTGLAMRVLIAGTDPTSRHVAEALDSRRAAGYWVIGFLAEPGEADDDDVVGTLDQVEKAIDELQPDAIVASPAALTPAQLTDLFLLLESRRTELIVYPTLVQVAAKRVDVETAGMLPLLHLSRVRMTVGKRALKRILDVVVAVVAGLASLPVLAVAAVAIRRNSPGPVFFRQERVGLDGRPFTLVKLRTMVVDAEDQLEELLDQNEAGDGLFKLRQDPRITTVGSTLRRLSIDELPQLWNVLVGDMSIVGPRPALRHEVDTQAEAALRRHRLKPGITGFWQVSGRSEVAADEALRMDLYYVENWSLAFDLLILAQTVRVVLAREGAY